MSANLLDPWSGLLLFPVEGIQELTGILNVWDLCLHQHLLLVVCDVQTGAVGWELEVPLNVGKN